MTLQERMEIMEEMPFTNKMTRDEERLVRAKMQAKLDEYFSLATDATSICDYVVIMLGNKKFRSQIAAELEASLSFVPLPPPTLQPPSTFAKQHPLRQCHSAGASSPGAKCSPSPCCIHSSLST